MNPHEINFHWNLNPARLPIPPHPHIKLYFLYWQPRFRETLAVPEIRSSLFASLNFDRCAFSLSLNRPQDAVKLKAANSITYEWGFCNKKIPNFYTAGMAEADHTDNSANGGDKRDRTADLLNAIQALSQLSYTPKCFDILS